MVGPGRSFRAHSGYRNLLGVRISPFTEEKVWLSGQDRPFSMPPSFAFFSRRFGGGDRKGPSSIDISTISRLPIIFKNESMWKLVFNLEKDLLISKIH